MFAAQRNPGWLARASGCQLDHREAYLANDRFDNYRGALDEGTRRPARDTVTDRGDRVAVARTIIDSNRYLTLATADADGRPWASPVYYVADGYRRFLWVSPADATHSRNLAGRPEVGIVIFDSRVAVAVGQAVYIEAMAAEVSGDELKRASQLFSRTSVTDHAGTWRLEDVVAPAPNRLYLASATAHYVLGERGERVTVGPDL